MYIAWNACGGNVRELRIWVMCGCGCGVYLYLVGGVIVPPDDYGHRGVFCAHIALAANDSAFG